MVYKTCLCEVWETRGAAHTFKDLYFRKATGSGATRSPDPAAKPSGSCSRLVREAAALEQTQATDENRKRAN